MKKPSIVYVNFAQYDNTGRILDYLLKNFDVVIQFSFDHLRLKNGRKTNFLRIYEEGKFVEGRQLASVRTPAFLLFASLPLVGISMFLQTIYYMFILTFYYGKFDIYFSVNAFSGWTGIVSERLHLVGKTVFWVWDYFPIHFPDWRIAIARWVYWQFDKPCMLYSDKIVYTNKKLFSLRKSAGHIPSETKPLIVPIGTTVKKIKISTKKKLIIGFLGMIKTTQGIDRVIASMPALLKRFPKLTLEIVGSGPDELRVKENSKNFANHIVFHGFIENQNEIEKIVGRWSAGMALYIADESNESYWGDPSKIKVYLSNGVPVITTNVSYMTSEIKRHQAGVIVSFDKQTDVTSALEKISKKQRTFQKNALLLAKKYNYEKVYKKLFEI